MKPLLPGGELGRRGAGLHPQRARGRWAWEEERQHLGTEPYAQALSRPSKFYCPWSDFVGGPRVTGRVQSRGGEVGGKREQPRRPGAKWPCSSGRCAARDGRSQLGFGGRAGEAAAAGAAERKALVKNRTRKEGRKQAERRHRGQWLKCKGGCGYLF